MPLSRRSVLRHAALLSLASAAGRSPLKALGQGRPSRPRQTPPPDFPPGIRVFFSGAWLFCPDSDSDRILAVTHEMQDSDCQGDITPCHRFPFGPWQDPDGMDFNPSLQPIWGGKPDRIEIADSVTKCTGIDDLFRNVTQGSPLIYLENKPRNPSATKPDLSVDLTLPTVRAISLPIPTRVVPATFLTNGTLNGDGNGRLNQQAAAQLKAQGIPTTHIFEYREASFFLLKDGRSNYLDSAEVGTDYHFHTVPIVPATSEHAIAMFRNLLLLVKSDSGTFTPDYLELNRPDGGRWCLDRGPDAPESVSDEELEMVEVSTMRLMRKLPPLVKDPSRKAPMFQVHIFDRTIASCASGGVAVGNGG